MRFILLLSVIAALGAVGCDSTTGNECTADVQCGSGARCLFPIGTCSSGTPIGTCEPNPSGPQCNAIQELCGCDGKTTVITGCGFQSGFASGPTSGTSGPCPVVDAGTDSGTDAGSDSGADAGSDSGTDASSDASADAADASTD
jgi:hypothetical protein